MRNEVWKAIPGYPEFDVSSLGRVRSRVPVILKQGLSSNGYRQVRITMNGWGRHELVHRLVLKAFTGPQPEGCQACHNDGDRMNNRPENLRWDTALNNAADRLKHGTQSRGLNHYNTKITPKDAGKIKEMLSRGESRKEIAQRFEVCSCTIRNIEKGKHWTQQKENKTADGREGMEPQMDANGRG